MVRPVRGDDGPLPRGIGRGLPWQWFLIDLALAVTVLWWLDPSWCERCEARAADHVEDFDAYPATSPRMRVGQARRTDRPGRGIYGPSGWPSRPGLWPVAADA
jgi:hypothetical protein